MLQHIAAEPQPDFEDAYSLRDCRIRWKDLREQNRLEISLLAITLNRRRVVSIGTRRRLH